LWPVNPIVPQLTCLARFGERCLCALFVENPMRILEAQDFVMLNEIDAIGLQPPERFVELSRRF